MASANAHTDRALPGFVTLKPLLLPKRVVFAGVVDSSPDASTMHVLALQVAVTHTPHRRSTSYAGKKPNLGQTWAMYFAMKDKRAEAYFSTSANGRAWFTKSTKNRKNNAALLSNFSKHVLSQEATAADSEKCMGAIIARTSTQPSAIYPSPEDSPQQTL
jgi:hypothetical protein